MGIPKIPSRELNPRFNHTFRFINSNSDSTSSSFIITVGNMMDLINFCTNGAAPTMYRSIGALRIKKIRIWGQFGVAPQTIVLEWLGNAVLGGRDVVFSDTSVGSVSTAYLEQKPPAGSQASVWLSNASTNSQKLFVIQCNGGNTIDISCDVVWVGSQPDEATPVSTAAFSGGPLYVTGNTYYKTLDGATGSLMPPILPFD
jgi:hypothetical protein